MSQLMAFGCFVLGGSTILLAVFGAVFSSTALLGAGVILGVPFMVLLVFTLFAMFDESRADRADD